MNKNYKFRCQGITLIEILLVMGLLVIIASFATPSLSKATTKAEMQAVAENIQYSIRIAQNTARMTETKVILNVQSDPASENHGVSFSVSDKALSALGQTGLQEYLLDDDFVLHAAIPNLLNDFAGQFQIGAVRIFDVSENCILRFGKQ